MGRLWAAAYDWVQERAERVEGPHRDRLVAAARGEVLEVGAGTGLNFPRYRAASRVVAVEPDEAMRERAMRRVPRATVPLQVIPGTGEALEFPDDSFDTAVACLVLCTIPSAGRALAEIGRVLRPGGELRFYEHVRSPKPGTARWQDRIDRAWGFLAGGCHANRDTVGAIEQAGFEIVELDAFDLPRTPAFVRRHVLGVARPRR